MGQKCSERHTNTPHNRIRSLVQTICIIWPIVTLVAALVDLYRSFETIRGLVHYIASGATYAEEVVLSCLGVAKSAVWYVFEPFVEYVWAALSDWWRSVVLTFVEDIGIVMSWVSWTLCSAWDFTTSIPLFTYAILPPFFLRYTVTRGLCISLLFCVRTIFHNLSR